MPGNERAVNETIDRIYEIGATVITARDAPIHASGHGWREELKLMLNLTKPRYVMPVHGDYKRIRLHSELAEAVGVDPATSSGAATGCRWRSTPTAPRFGEDIHAGTMYVDGVNIGDPDDAALRDRREISADGIFIVVVTISAEDGTSSPTPRSSSAASPSSTKRTPWSKTQRPGRRLARRRRRRRHREPHLIQEDLHDAVGKFVFEKLRRRPMVVPGRRRGLTSRPAAKSPPGSVWGESRRASVSRPLEKSRSRG